MYDRNTEARTLRADQYNVKQTVPCQFAGLPVTYLYYFCDTAKGRNLPEHLTITLNSQNNGNNRNHISTGSNRLRSNI